MKNEQLFSKNINLLQRLNKQFEDKIELAQAINGAKEKAVVEDLSFEAWLQSGRKSIVLPLYLPRSKDAVISLEEYVNGCGVTEPGSIDPFRELHADYHSAKVLLGIKDLISSANMDPYCAATTLNPGCVSNCIFLGTGQGKTLLHIIESIKPCRILIAIDQWSDIISSFWHIDWDKLYHYCADHNLRLEIVRVKSDEELLHNAASYSLLGIDHSIVYQPIQSEESLVEKSNILFGRRPASLIEYLGYTVDEYNMIINSVETLNLQPKILRTPSYPLGFKAVICASGPSLDESLEQLRELQDSHIIIAAGSSIRTLLRAGIRVDLITLLERDQGTAEAYTELSSEFDLTNVRLIMSTTCYSELIPLFKDPIVFFRPAITPIAIFSSNSREKLEFEGPESVNAAVAFCCQVGAEEVVFFGVDLGTSNMNRARSLDAAGFTPREFNMTVEGNLEETAFTTKPLMDCMHQIKTCLGIFSGTTKTYNTSNGVKIDNAEPITPAQYIANQQKGISHANEELFEWWNSLPYYTRQRIRSSWTLRRPRANTAELCKNLKGVFGEEHSWFPSILLELDKVLSLAVPMPQQIPVRIVRSTVYRAALAISQQLQAMYYEREKAKKFILLSKELLFSLIDQLEQEIYSLCDFIEEQTLGDLKK